MNEFTFDLHKNKWVLSHFATITDSVGYFEVPPVIIVDWHDKVELKLAIQNLLAQPMSVFALDTLNPQEPLGVRAKSVGAKSAGAYVRETRCFYLQREKNALSLEEWSKTPGGWSTTPVWKEKFSIDQLDKLIEFLMQKTRPELPLKNATSKALRVAKKREKK